MALFVPALLGSVLFATFLFGSKKSEKDVKEEFDAMSTEEQQATVDTAKAAEAKDWMNAVASAIKSNSPKVLKELAAKMKKEGLKDEAAELLKIAKSLEEVKAAKPKTTKPAPVLQKPTTGTPVVLPKPAPSKPAPSKPAPTKQTAADKAKKAAADKAKAEAAKKKSEADKAAKKKEDAAAKKKAEADKLRKQAEELKAHLLSTGRYKENQEYVKNYQKNAKLEPDGKYGPNTARSFWSLYKVVPANPFYWSTNVNQRAKDVTAYKAFLNTIKADAPKHAAEVDRLYPTVGK